MGAGGRNEELKEKTCRNDGALFHSACFTMVCQPGVLATLVPSVIERRPRCGLFGASGLSPLGGEGETVACRRNEKLKENAPCGGIKN